MIVSASDHSKDPLKVLLSCPVILPDTLMILTVPAYCILYVFCQRNVCVILLSEIEWGSSGGPQDVLIRYTKGITNNVFSLSVIVDTSQLSLCMYVIVKYGHTV